MFILFSLTQNIELWQILLSFANKTDESRQVADFALVFLREGEDVLVGDYECQVSVLHFLQLVLGYARLEGEEVLVLDALGLVEHLTPAVFARCLHAEHRQAVGGENDVVVALAVGEEEVGLVVVFGHGLLLEDYLVNDSWFILENANILGRL